VTLDRANRSFLVIVAVALALGAFMLCGVVGGALLPLIAARISQGELIALSVRPSMLSALLILALVVTGLGRGGCALARQLLASRRLARRVHARAVTVPDDLAGAARQAGMDGRVVLLDVPDSFSFVYGILSPRVAVSRGLLERTSPLELRAVLEHERYHLRNLDPLKIVLVRTLTAALFLLPALDSLCARYVAGRELAADRRAVAICGRVSLAGALLTVVGAPEWGELAVAAAATGARELLDARVLQLETGREPKPEGLSAARVTLSLMGTTSVAAILLVTVSSLAGPAAAPHASDTGFAAATVLDSLSCTASFAAAALLAYAPLALRARRPSLAPASRPR
jgi:Zn-dependent protease with chaperone function